MEILAIIPARGGSKGILRKNLRPICDKPLIYYSIAEAKKSKYLTHITVSTEDEEIAEVAAGYGAEVIPRPKEYASDDATMYVVIKHALEYLRQNKGYNPDLIVLLHPTSPLRVVGDIDNAIKLYLDNKQCKSVVGVAIQLPPPQWAWQIKDGYLKPLMGKKYFLVNRQQLPTAYFDAPIYVIKPGLYIKNRAFITNRTFAYVMPAERAIDIDGQIELEFAEFLMKKRIAGR